MEQIKEAELSTLANSINQKTVNVIIKGDISAEYTIPYVVCEYDKRSGIFYIDGKLTNSVLIINMSYVYMIRATADRKIIEFNTDGTNNDGKIRIKIL